MRRRPKIGAERRRVTQAHARSERRSADNLTPAQRTLAMRSVKSRDTTPEIAVRRLVHGMGYRYRLHRPDLPGTPDLVFPSRRKVIFIHGCFWHQHRCKAEGEPAKVESALLAVQLQEVQGARQGLLGRDADWKQATI